MVVEHTFVTTMEPSVALSSASQFLASRGFVNENGASFDVGATEWTSLEMRRGKSPSRAKSVAQLPQVVRLQYDRGRVVVALSILPSATWGGSSFGLSSATDGNPKKMHLHTDLLMGIATGLERLLARGEPHHQAGAAWADAEARIAEAASRRNARNIIILIVIAALIAIVVTLTVVNA